MIKKKKKVISLNGANKGSIAGSSCDAKHFPDRFLLYTPSLWDEKMKYARLRSHRVFKEMDCNDPPAPIGKTLRRKINSYARRQSGD